MKGIGITEFLDLVESKFGLEMVDKITGRSNKESEGAYTAVGTCQFSKILQLLQYLQESTGVSIDDLLLVYAEHFFKVLAGSCPDVISAHKTPFEMLSSIENHIHLEVKKIYPIAKLPTFQIIEKSGELLVAVYKSSQAMYCFRLGTNAQTFVTF